MTFRNTSKASYVGFTRVNTPDGASGVWNMNQQAIESDAYLWPGQSLYTNSGNSLSGFTNNGANTSGGNINVSGSQYCYINPLLNYPSMLFKTITMEVIVTGGVMAILFGHSAAGRGPLLKLDTRGGANYTGLMFQTDWATLGKAPTGGFYVLPNVWTPIKLQINNAARVDWFTDNLFRDRQPVLLNGPFLGILGFGGGGSVRNIRVYNGAT